MLISGIILVIGIVFCLIGMGIASSSGEQLFATTKGEDSYYTYTFGDGVTDRIKISVEDAHVNIFGGAEKNYIEIVNFDENSSSYSANGATVTFTQTEEIEDITGLWESGVGFKGLRHLFVSGDNGGEKAVNIYISNDEHVKNIEIKLARGNVEISDLSRATDYSVSLESGKVKVSNVKTTKSLAINSRGDASSTTVILDGVSTMSTEVNAKRAKLKAGALETDECNVSIGSGSVEMIFVPRYELFCVDVVTAGVLEVDGDDTLSKTYNYTNIPEDDGKDDKDDESVPDDSSLKISGDNLKVVLDTPLEDKTNAETTAPVE